MTEAFKAFEPGIEVVGGTILATIDGMEADINPLLAKHGIETVVADHWYPQQAWLDVLKDISDGGDMSAMFDLVSIGTKIPDNVTWPPEINSVESALMSIDVAYHMNHRGGKIGSYTAEILETNHIRITCDNPYPSDFDYGILYRTVQKFKSQGEDFSVQRANSPSRLKGDDRCVYDITWG